MFPYSPMKTTWKPMHNFLMKNVSMQPYENHMETYENISLQSYEKHIKTYEQFLI